jgi:hypothetical protein
LGGEGLSFKCSGEGSEERSKGETSEILEANKIERLILRYDRISYLSHCIIPQVDQYPRTIALFFLNQLELEARELFNSLMEDSGTHVELGDDEKYEMKGKGTVMF